MAFVAIGAGCKEDWLHVNADWAILEPVDENMNPVQPGQPSHTVLLTNLINRVQPIIRYNLGDRITLRSDACPCGNPFPAIRVEGRTDEILHLQAETRMDVPVLPLALWAVIKETAGVQRFQIVQTGPAEIKIRLQAVPEAARLETWERVTRAIHSFLGMQGLSNVKVLLDDALPVRDPRSGKFRHVWAEMKEGVFA